MICHFENADECVLFFMASLDSFSIDSFVLEVTGAGEGVQPQEYFDSDSINVVHTGNMTV